MKKQIDLEIVKNSIRNIPDFPKPGIHFKDGSTSYQDALTTDDVVLIHDDLLATGGTVGAAIDLVRKFWISKIYINFYMELDFLKGIDKIDSSVPSWSLIHF